jgi:hypothetical protein
VDERETAKVTGDLGGLLRGTGMFCYATMLMVSGTGARNLVRPLDPVGMERSTSSAEANGTGMRVVPVDGRGWRGRGGRFGVRDLTIRSRSVRRLMGNTFDGAAVRPLREEQERWRGPGGSYWIPRLRLMLRLPLRLLRMPVWVLGPGEVEEDTVRRGAGVR